MRFRLSVHLWKYEDKILDVPETLAFAYICFLGTFPTFFLNLYIIQVIDLVFIFFVRPTSEGKLDVGRQHVLNVSAISKGFTNSFYLFGCCFKVDKRQFL